MRDDVVPECAVLVKVVLAAVRDRAGVAGQVHELPLGRGVLGPSRDGGGVRRTEKNIFNFSHTMFSLNIICSNYCIPCRTMSCFPLIFIVKVGRIFATDGA